MSFNVTQNTKCWWNSAGQATSVEEKHSWCFGVGPFFRQRIQCWFAVTVVIWSLWHDLPVGINSNGPLALFEKECRLYLTKIILIKNISLIWRLQNLAVRSYGTISLLFWRRREDVFTSESVPVMGCSVPVIKLDGNMLEKDFLRQLTGLCCME